MWQISLKMMIYLKSGILFIGFCNLGMVYQSGYHTRYKVSGSGYNTGYHAAGNHAYPTSGITKNQLSGYNASPTVNFSGNHASTTMPNHRRFHDRPTDARIRRATRLPYDRPPLDGGRAPPHGLYPRTHGDRRTSSAAPAGRNHREHRSHQHHGPPQCRICSKPNHPIFHRHFSSKQARKEAGVEFSESPYWCGTCRDESGERIGRIHNHPISPSDEENCLR